MFLFVISVSTVLGSDKVSGSLSVNGRPIPVKHVYAILHDNAEGFLDSSPELRVLVTDREVPIDVLYGFMFLPADDLARRDELQGVLLRFDPAKLGAVNMTILMRSSLRKDTDKVKINEFEFGPDRLSGSFEFNETSFLTFPDYPKANFNLKVDTVVKRIPNVTADLKGRDAVNSPQVKALKVIANALAKGDMKAFESLSSQRALRRNKEDSERSGTDGKEIAIKFGRSVQKLIPRAERVVVRGNMAVVILPENTVAELLFENGSWKAN